MRTSADGNSPVSRSIVSLWKSTINLVNSANLRRRPGRHDVNLVLLQPLIVVGMLNNNEK